MIHGFTQLKDGDWEAPCAFCQDVLLIVGDDEVDVIEHNRKAVAVLCVKCKQQVTTKMIRDWIRENVK